MDRELIHKLKSYSLLRRKSLAYKFFINGHEKQLICPMLNFHNRKNVVLWPSIKLPFRKYPVHIYLYAVALYLTSGMNMREAALKVCQTFKLESFSHSTLSRVLKKLSENIDELLTIIEAALSPPESSPTFVERVRWGSGKSIKYKKLLSLICPVLIKGSEITFCSSLNYKYYNKTHKFVI